MLASQLGIRLLLWAGRTIPRPVPAELLLALTEATVTNDAEGDDGFQLTFAVGKGKAGEYEALQGGALDPDARVIIGVVMGAAPEPLIDGVIFHHQLRPGQEPGSSTLTVTGRDVRVMMDLHEVNAPYPNQSAAVIVQQILAKPAYAPFGLVPQITPVATTPLQIQLVPGQHETDLQYVKALAERNGFVFYLEPLTLGTNTAYWGPRQRTGLPQPALTFSLGSLSSAQEMYFTNDALGPVSAEGTFTDPVTKQSIAIPALPSLQTPPLAAQPAAARRTQLMRDTANRDPAQAATDLLARMTNAPQGVDCTGRLDGVRYGQVLRARRLVGVRGVGTAYNGPYYVKSVTHRLTRGSYTQEFTLQREGTGSLVPAIPP